MSLMTISPLLITTLFLGSLQVSSTYHLPTSRFQDRFVPIERDSFPPYWMDDDDIDGEAEEVEVAGGRVDKRSRSTVPSLPQYLERLKKFHSLRDKEKYVAALNSYYMIFGRPSWSRTYDRKRTILDGDRHSEVAWMLSGFIPSSSSSSSPASSSPCSRYRSRSCSRSCSSSSSFPVASKPKRPISP
ncbi:hypothetical protein TcWFU_003577 [Taenia crassiceps]|uniref:Uncharacterized protein n=1 Tax=Taenia crassiceps TaxID=6207 RepID=A0ABR4PZW7_9CEST